MRKVIAGLVSAAVVATSVPATSVLFAAPAGQGQTLGTVTGTATDASKNNLANYTVRLRNVQTNSVSDTTVSNSAGQFTFTGVNPANYTIEIVNSAGQVVGTSAAVTVTGGTITISVAASSALVGAGAAGAAGAGAAAAGGGLFAGTGLLLVAGAVAAGVATVAVVATKNDASGSQ